MDGSEDQKSTIRVDSGCACPNTAECGVGMMDAAS